MRNITLRPHREDFRIVSKIAFGETVLEISLLLQPAKGQILLMDYSDAYAQAEKILTDLGLEESNSFYRTFPMGDYALAIDIDFASDSIGTDDLVAEIAGVTSKRLGRVLVLTEDGDVPVGLWSAGSLVETFDEDGTVRKVDPRDDASEHVKK